MKVLKRTTEHTFYKRNDNRYSVQVNKTGLFLKGEEKIKYLLSNQLIKLTAPKKKEEAPATEATA